MDDERAHELAQEVIRLCKEKGLTGDEIFIIGATSNDIEAIEMFGEEEAILITIDAIKKAKSRDEVFDNVFTALGVDLND